MFGQNHLLIVALVSLFLGGAIGMFLNGQTKKGIISIVVTIGLVIVGFLTFGLGFLALAAFEIVAKVDAIIIANKLQNGIPVGPDQWF